MAAGATRHSGDKDQELPRILIIYSSLSVAAARPQPVHFAAACQAGSSKLPRTASMNGYRGVRGVRSPLLCGLSRCRVVRNIFFGTPPRDPQKPSGRARPTSGLRAPPAPGSRSRSGGSSGGSAPAPAAGVRPAMDAMENRGRSEPFRLDAQEIDTEPGLARDPIEEYQHRLALDREDRCDLLGSTPRPGQRG